MRTTAVVFGSASPRRPGWAFSHPSGGIAAPASGIAANHRPARQGEDRASVVLQTTPSQNERELLRSCLHFLIRAPTRPAQHRASKPTRHHLLRPKSSSFVLSSGIFFMRSRLALSGGQPTPCPQKWNTVTDQLFRGYPFSFDALGDAVADRLVDVPPILERAREYGLGHSVLEVADDVGDQPVACGIVHDL